MLRLALWSGLLLQAAAALAQDQDVNIPWQTEPSQAVADARRQNRPLMVYVLASTRDRDERLERDQRIAFNDRRVLELSQRFVPLRLSRSANREILGDFHLPENANMMLSFVAPDGKSLGQLGPVSVAHADALAAKLAAVVREFGEKLYTEQGKAVLEDVNAKPNELRQTLRMVAEFGVASAESAVVALLERRLESPLRIAVYETLAALSTKAAIGELLQRARDGDKQAATALEKCTPVAAEFLLPELQAQTNPVDYPLYKALTKICRIPNAKSPGFFKSAKGKATQEELDRVTRLATEAVRAWREENDATNRPAQ